MASKVAVKALDRIVLTVRSVPATVAFYGKLLVMKHQVSTSAKDGDVERYTGPPFSSSFQSIQSENSS